MLGPCPVITVLQMVVYSLRSRFYRGLPRNSETLQTAHDNGISTSGVWTDFEGNSLVLIGTLLRPAMGVRLVLDEFHIMKRNKNKTSSIRRKYTIHISSQLTPHRLLLPNNPHLRPTITQANLPTLHTGHKPHTLPSLRILLPSPPNLRNKTIARLDRRREPRRKLSQIRRIATAQQLQQPAGRGVPRVQAVQDRAAETHRLAWLRRRVQGVVIAVQAI